MTDKKARSVKHWSGGERPRERLTAHGPAALANAQLLAIIIKNDKAGRTALDLAVAILVKSNDFAGIEQAGIKDICEEPGIWPAKAAEIKAAIEPGRRLQKPGPSIASREPLCSSETMVQYYQSTLEDGKEESFHCVLLATKNKVIRADRVSVGSLTASIVHLRETFKAAIRESAAAVIFIHDHPSGDIQPSQEDILLIRRLVQAGEVLGIQVLDHIIIGDGCHLSFRDNRMIGRRP
jgi:DNA repair protein RadC